MRAHVNASIHPSIRRWSTAGVRASYSTCTTVLYHTRHSIHFGRKGAACPDTGRQQREGSVKVRLPSEGVACHITNHVLRCVGVCRSKHTWRACLISIRLFGPPRLYSIQSLAQRRAI